MFDGLGYELLLQSKGQLAVVQRATKFFRYLLGSPSTFTFYKFSYFIKETFCIELIQSFVFWSDV